MLRFANRYGSVEWTLHRSGGSGEYSHGRFTDWLKDVRWMKERVTLADAVDAGDLSAIRDARRPLSGCVSYAPERAAVMHTRIDGEGPDPQRLTADGVARVAAAVLYQPLPEGLDWCPAASWNPKTRSVDVRLKYWGLRQFMYGQLCISLVGGRRFQQCK